MIKKIVLTDSDFQVKVINLGSGFPKKNNCSNKNHRKKCNLKVKIKIDKIYKEEMEHTGSNSIIAKEKFNITFKQNISEGMYEFINWYKKSSDVFI